MVEESLIAYYKNALLEEAIGHTVITSNENVMFPEAASGKRGQLELTAKLDNNPWKGKEEELEKKLRILLSDGNTENPFSQSDTEKLVRATGNAKILDPACGSGAFPMGVLHKMVYVLRKLDPENKRWKQEQIDRNELEKKEIEKRIDSDIEAVSKIHSEDVKKKAIAELEEKKKSIEVNFREHEADYARKLYLIENCIYGVDIQPIAVQITKLRFFISLIVDQKINPTHKNLGIIPLPNLETKFVAANTLVGLEQPHEEELLSKKDSILLKLENDLNAIRKKYFYSRSRSEKIKLKQNDKSLRDKILEHFLSKNDKFKKDLENILKIGRLPKESVKEIFAYIDNRESESASALQQLVAQLCKQNKMDTGISKKAIEECHHYFPPKSASDIASWDPYDQNSSAGWFDPEHMFGISTGSMTGSGFDVVIGNPPYGVSIRDEYRDSVLKYLGKVPDFEIYYYFIEFAYKVLKINGANCYIIPNTILFNTFAKKFRTELIEKWNINQIIDCTNFKLFEGATVFNIIYLFIKNQIALETVGFKRVLETEQINDFLKKPMQFIPKQELIENNVNWSLVFKLDKNITDIIKKIKANSIECNLIYPELSQGLIAYDKYQGQKQEIIDKRAFHYSKKEKSGLKKWLWGEDVTRYSVIWNGKEYIDYCDGIANPREPKYFKKERLLIREITNPRIYATITSDELYNDPSILIVLGNTKYTVKFLVAIINSSLATFFHFNYSPKATKGGFPKILIEDMKHFPIPRSPIDNPKLQQPLITLVDKILSAKGKDPLADTSKWENEIDARVFHLYGLTEEEMLTVLNSFPKISQEEKDLIVKIYREVG